MTWPMLLREMQRCDAPFPAYRWDDDGAYQALRLGLIRLVKKRTNYEPGLYGLTDLGREWLEGRVDFRRKRPGGTYFVATWLRALPKDIRITPGSL